MPAAPTGAEAHEAGLDQIALGDATITEARGIVQRALEKGDCEKEVVTALRAWTWKALTHRRQDPALGDWHWLICRVEARLRTAHPALAAKAEILAQLVYESIASSDISDPEMVLQRSHARLALAMLERDDRGEAPLTEVASALSLPRGSATRIANMMVDAGLATLRGEGDDRVLAITRLGQEAAAGVCGPTARARIGALPQDD